MNLGYLRNHSGLFDIRFVDWEVYNRGISMELIIISVKFINRMAFI